MLKSYMFCLLPLYIVENVVQAAQVQKGMR